jgi:hypothetical protein
VAPDADMARDYLTDEYGSEPQRGSGLFGWTVFILLLIGFAFASWIGSFYIFGHPENPRSYKWLKKLKKIEAPKRFEVTAGPPGKFYTAKELYDFYLTFSRLQLQQENEQLLRDYIRNFTETKKLVPYVVGRFAILDTQELKNTDVFQSGVVAMAQSVDFPQVLIEHVYTTPAENVPMLRQMLGTGLDIKLERTLDLSAVVHIEKLYDGKLLFTVVPLLYGSYALKQGAGGFSLEPPPELNLAAGLPVVKTAGLDTAFKTFAAYRKKKGLSEKIISPALLANSSTPAPSQPAHELVRVDEPTPPPAPTPPATAWKGPVTRVGPPGASPATPPPTASRGQPSPPPVAMTNPNVQPPPGPGVKLEPFIGAQTAPGATPAAGTWRVYRPGQMPRGRLLDSREASALANAGIGGERLYLSGQFLVTASGDNRAVLRPQGSVGKQAGATRVIVNFPPGMPAPSEGSTFGRDQMRPFQITDVRRGTDGQVNVYVREITTGE